MNELPMTNLPIHITPHHLSLTASLRDFVVKKTSTLPRFARDVIAADIVLRRHHGTSTGKKFSASARLAMPGHDIHGTAAHADLYTAVGKLMSRLARRSRKRKTRFVKRRASDYNN
jgi:putative sigma-54 modulation protein